MLFDIFCQWHLVDIVTDNNWRCLVFRVDVRVTVQFDGKAKCWSCLCPVLQPHNSATLAMTRKSQSLPPRPWLYLFKSIQWDSAPRLPPERPVPVLIHVFPSARQLQSEEPHSNVRHELTGCPRQVSSCPGVSFPNQGDKVVSLSDFWALPRCASSSSALATLTRNHGPIETQCWKTTVGRLEESRECLLVISRGTSQNTGASIPFRWFVYGGKAFSMVPNSISEIQVTPLWNRNEVKATLLTHYLLRELYENMSGVSNVKMITDP